jgi:hypothetical protein
MANKITYYAIVTDGSTPDRPQGLLRRLEHDNGPQDEGLYKDGGWRWTSMLIEYENGSTDEDLVVVSHEQASKIVEYLRDKFAGGGARSAGT